MGEERESIGDGILAREELVAGRELAQARERLRVGAAGEEPARHVCVGFVLLEPGEELVERGRGHGLHEREQPEVLARIEAHRRRGEEEDAVGRAAERRDRRVERVVGEVVRLVHHEEVERDLGGGVHEVRVVAQRLEGDDRMGRARERRLRATERGDPLGREEREERVELVEELGEPLEGEVLGDDDEDALGDAELAHAGEDEARLDRLAEADLVGEDEPRQPVREDPAGGADLVREDVDAGGEQRAERVRAPERLEPGDAGAERERGGRAVLARGERVERATGPRLLERGVGRDLDERGVAPGDDRDAFPAGEADREPPPLVGDLDDHAHAPAALRAVDHLRPCFPGHRWRPLTIGTRAGKARPPSRPSRLGPSRACRHTVDTGVCSS